MYTMSLEYLQHQKGRARGRVGDKSHLNVGVFHGAGASAQRRRGGLDCITQR